MSIVVDKDLIKTLKADTDSQLKDLFERSKVDDLENDEKINNLLLKTDVNENDELVSYIPETFSQKDKIKEIIKKKKKDKQNEKELDIETSKVREIEIADKNRARNLQRDINLEKEIGLELKDENKDLDKKDDDNKIEDDRSEREELERQEEIEREREEKGEEKERERKMENEEEEKASNELLNNYGTLKDEKKDSQNEDELDIETEREIRRQQEIENKNQTVQRSQDVVKQEETEKESARDIVKEIIDERNSVSQGTNISSNDNNKSTLGGADNSWNTFTQGSTYTGNENFGGGESPLIPWEFNGILTITDGETTKTELFYRNGKEETYLEAKKNVMEAKEEFIKMCETIAQSGNYYLLVRDPCKISTLLLYEEGHKDMVQENISQKNKEVPSKSTENSKQNTSFVESLGNSRNSNSQNNGGGKGIDNGSGKGNSSGSKSVSSGNGSTSRSGGSKGSGSM